MREEDIEKMEIEEEIKRYINEMGYSEQQVAVYLLGHLMGEVGGAQWSKETPTKPILNKIVYQGMGVEKLKLLTNEIFEKLNQYKVLSYNNEAVFAEYKGLLDKNIDAWSLTDQENVFYILSGYAYNTYKRMRKGGKKNG